MREALTLVLTEAYTLSTLDTLRDIPKSETLGTFLSSSSTFRHARSLCTNDSVPRYCIPCAMPERIVIRSVSWIATLPFPVKHECSDPFTYSSSTCTDRQKHMHPKKIPQKKNPHPKKRGRVNTVLDSRMFTLRQRRAENVARVVARAGISSGFG